MLTCGINLAFTVAMVDRMPPNKSETMKVTVLGKCLRHLTKKNEPKQIPKRIFLTDYKKYQDTQQIKS